MNGKMLEQYKIQFSTPVNYGLLNKITTIDKTMSQFIGDNYTNYDAGVLLQTVNQVLNDASTDKMEICTQSLQLAVITKSVTNLYFDVDDYEADNTVEPSFSLPTADFQVIVEAWRDYLANSPTTK